jgi:hypothetical protein
MVAGLLVPVWEAVVRLMLSVAMPYHSSLGFFSDSYSALDL